MKTDKSSLLLRNKTIMVQGTGSGVGKSLIATALCRILYQDGFRVAPFKAINISLNSGVTPENEEMAISQIVQAQAAGTKPHSLMNPFLIKPQKNSLPQIIIRGKVANKNKIQENYMNKDGLWLVAKKSFDTLSRNYDVVILEGAASPAEPSFIKDDVVNLKIAKYAKPSVILVGDIDKGGVFASLEGTISILRRNDSEAARLIQGIIINKYRGEKRYLGSACKELTEVTGIPVVGIIPFIESHGIADEDTWFLEDTITNKEDAVLDIAIIHTPSLQNSHDFDPLIEEPGVQVRFVSKAKDFGNPDLVILAGSKNTVYDLRWIKDVGFGKFIIEHASKGKAIIGICGGFQMLGKTILDPLNMESIAIQTKGLGLLPTTTIFKSKKTIRQVQAKVIQNDGLLKGAYGMEISGYEIHMGRTENNGETIPSIFCFANGLIMGTYLHDLFRNNNLRKLVLQNIAQKKGVMLPFKKRVRRKDIYSGLAKIVRKNLDMKLLYQIMTK